MIAEIGGTELNAMSVPSRLSVNGLSKAFDGTQALRSVSFSIQPGEVHGLVGHNGSGKSTLIKILAGFHVPDAGSIEIDDVPVMLPLSAADAAGRGLAFVHQDLALMPSLSVADNLLMGELSLRAGWYLNRRRMRRRVVRYLAEFHLEIDPDAPVASLTGGQRAGLAILRATLQAERAGEGQANRTLRLLVLDEPTVFLDQNDRQALYSLVHNLAMGGSSVLLVSHDLEEVVEVCGSITVLRDGQVVHASGSRPKPTVAELVILVTGREDRSESAELEDKRSTKQASTDTATALHVKGLSGRWVRDTSFSLMRGEILGLTGVLGSGFDSVPRLLFGAEKATSGEASFNDGRPISVPHLTPAHVIGLGVAYVPEDRPREGQAGALRLDENMSMLVLSEYFRYWRRRLRQMREDAQQLVRAFNILPPNSELLAKQFSGGNQQKALLAKWLRIGPRVILLNEPTQGVDVGARMEIFQILRGLALRGSSVIVASSDLDQLASLADRVLVFREGTPQAELRAPNITKGTLSAASYEAAGLKSVDTT